MSARPPKAADISDFDMLAVIAGIIWTPDSVGRPRMWALTYDLFEHFPNYPAKVVRAKAGQLIKRGLISGCACGCRGDFEITSSGREYLEDNRREEAESPAMVEP